MSTAKTGQVNRTAADVYDEFFVPALFREWAPRVADAAGIGRGDRVLDVGCGTGVLARHAAERVGPDGSVVGVDVNDGMLDVARREAPEVEWRQARAESLPFDTASFDAAVSQFALMFFDDTAAAVREMLRVTRPEGRAVVAVWDGLSSSPGYGAVADLLARLFGDEVAAALHAPFALGDTSALRSILDAADAADAEIRTVTGTARFPSIRSWMHTEIRGWTLADRLDDDQFEELAAAAESELARFTEDEGIVRFDIRAHVVVAR